MDVTRHNFQSVVGELEALLDRCEFVAIDEEMTGIFGEQRVSPANTLADNYPLQKAVAERFAIIQIGVCPFVKDPSHPDGWVAHPFNFFVFPEGGKDIVLSPASVAFNLKNGMDFQKWISQGVPYVTTAVEKALREKTWPTPAVTEDSSEERPAKRQKLLELQKEGDRTWYTEEWRRFQTWLAEPYAEGREFPIKDQNRVQREYFEAQVQKHHPELALDSRLKNPDSGSWARTFFVVQRSEQARREKEAKDAADREAEFHRKVGFHRVFKALVDKKKPLVGHNLLYDLLFMMAAFHGELPATWGEWKALTHTMFPTIYDTKYLAQCRHIPHGRFETTALEPLYHSIAAQPTAPRISLPQGFEAYAKESGSGRAHEAAYDALMTGTVFAALMKELEGHAPELVNRVNLMASVFELYLAGPDPLGHEHGPILHLTFEKTVKTPDLLNCFGELPGRVSWINDVSAHACMGLGVDPEAALLQLRGQTLLKTVQPFEEWLAEKEAKAAK